jgi:chromosome segregation ATPase|tara:strand:- start:2 stop:355 length:354 start_codon:yes stop_codon:yes gene_type:complete
MKPQDVALWVGLASSVGGAAIGYGTLTEKVASLEKNNAPTALEGRLVKLETRIEDNDIGKIGKEIEQLRGRVDNLAEKVNSISIPSTSDIEKDVVVLKEQVKGIKTKLKELGNNPLL